MKQKSKFRSSSLLFLNYKFDFQLIDSNSINLKYLWSKTIAVFIVILMTSGLLKAQLPSNVLVGYHEEYGTSMSIVQTGAGANYNVIDLAFAVPNSNGCTCSMTFTPPSYYGSIAAMIPDIDAVHAAGKKVILSIGGSGSPIYLASTADKNTFISTMNSIFAAFSNKIDGLDLDLEGTSIQNWSSGWTLASPTVEQTNLITAVQSIMATYQTNTGKKLILTMAPETLYVFGALSSGQVTGHGGKFLPIIDGLRAELDLLHVQLYNSGSMYAWDGIVYNQATPEFALALSETLVKGFTCQASKGYFAPIPANKIAFGLPATSAAAPGGGFLSYTQICQAAEYFKGTIAKPSGWTYTMTASYPTLKGLMTWDMNADKTASWGFANAYTCGFPASAPVSLLDFSAKRSGTNVNINWATANETNNDYFALERSSNGVSFSEITKIKGLGTSVSGQSYEYTDFNTNAENNYYRLAQYDIDGTVHYSDIVAVAPITGSSGLHISSNPFDEVLVVIPYGMEDRTETTISVIDCSGKVLSTKNVQNNEECRIGEEYKSGFYILQYQYKGETQRYKVVKK